MSAKKSSSSLHQFLFSHSLVWLSLILVIIIDQITKNLVLTRMQPNESIPVFKSIFHLTYVQNTGIAFGLFQDANLFFAILSLAIIIAIVLYLPHVGRKEGSMQICLGMVLGGALGNLIDRIFLGFVVDFLDFRVWPVFNVADSAISISILCLAILLWKK